MTNLHTSAIWHPFTQHALNQEMTHIESAKGAYLNTGDGRKIFDAISSWWVITHGHCHPVIIEAIKTQAEKLDQIIFAGHTHEPAQKVAQELVKITPDSLEYVFFTDSGSTSVEVALKMALGFWRHNKIKREKIIVMKHSYHGDTIGTMSVGERGVFNRPYEPLLFDVSHIPFPGPGNEQQSYDALEGLCKQGNAAAFIVEPLVLGAGGMLMYKPSVLKELHRICKKNDVLFIADEVMTGWGRTGSRFACEQAQISPDIACYSKGITGGSLPLAVTLCTADIYKAHYSSDRSKTFFHSSSYTANPIACAAAYANLQIWNTENVQQKIDAISAFHKSKLAVIHTHPQFENIRYLGTIAAVDFIVTDHGYLSNLGPALYAFFQSQNILLRPLGNTVYIMPPFCSSSEDLEKTYRAIVDAADKIASRNI